MIGVVAGERAVFIKIEGVHRTDALCFLRQAVAKRDHRLLEGDGHIEPVKAVAADKGLKFARRKLDEAVFAIVQPLVDQL